jgi:signal recognition particle subunit SRP54
VHPVETLLVVDAMTGQEAVGVAQAFAAAVPVTGLVLTKIDGDARGGAALSVRSVTGKPILYVSTGEKLDAIEVFHPDRMASRILGMGDVVSLVERAQEATTADEQAQMEKAMREGQFTFDDFLKAYRMLQRMGPLGGLLKMIPGAPSVDVDEGQMKRVEAMILSMTPRERTMPHTIDGQRRQRIANGSGTAVQEVNKLIESRKMMERMMKGGGGMPSLPGMPGAGGAPGGGQRSAKLTQKQKKKKRKAGRR